MGYEMLVGNRPFNGPERSDFREQHLTGQPPTVPSSVPVPLAALLEQCLSKGPETGPTPADVLSRLQRQVSATPVASGLAALQEASRAQVGVLSEQSRRASEAHNEAERRAALRQDANRQLRGISVTLLEALRANAPAAVESFLKDRTASADRAQGWRLRLGDATFDFEPESFLETAPPLSFDVIDWCRIAVTRPANRFGYTGREHVLWFSDAKERGQYRWYETAFARFSMGVAPQQSVAPFGVVPLSQVAVDAIMPGVQPHGVAWPSPPWTPARWMSS